MTLMKRITIPNKIRININAFIVGCSVPGRPQECAIAKRVEKLFSSAQRIIADPAGLNFSIPENRKRYDFKIPRWVAPRMEKFDRTGKMEPFAFTAEYRGDKPMGLGDRIVIRKPKPFSTKPYRAATTVMRKWGGVAQRVPA
jgi:hypothetical protein